jgi:2,4-dienoyl-CoA reductase-like NADH-dependent reductase (Old Yellow Enzyme family)
MLKSHTLRNRVVWLPHSTGYADDCHVSACHVAYYTERARHGVAMIIMGSEAINPMYGEGRHVSAYDPEGVDAYRRLSDAVHEHGTVLIGQLTEHGNTGSADHTLDWDYEHSPSAVVDRPGGRRPKAIERHEIAETIELWARSAGHHKRGGFDGTELKVAHSGLPREFLSPFFNRRQDEYGGSRENRLRYLKEVLTAVRAEVGAAHLVGIRYTLAEHIRGGYDLEEAIAMLQVIEGWGLIDYVTSDMGVMTARRFSSPPMATPQGFAREAIAAAKRSVELPVIAYGRIKNPSMAEDVLALGQADLVGMARALITDPEWVEKARDGRAEDIRACIACNQACFDRIIKGVPITCILNPSSGREQTWGSGTLRPASVQKRVAVIGGGPAGLKTAEVAARRGHRITVFEADELGGGLNTITLVDTRQEFGEARTWLFRQVMSLGVELRTGREILPSDIRETTTGGAVIRSEAGEDEFDELILATGARTAPAQFPAAGVEDALRHPERVGRRVLIADSEGTYSSISAAEFFARRGHAVTLVTSNIEVGVQIGPAGRQVFLPELFRLGVRIQTQTEMLGWASPSSVSCRQVGTEQKLLVEADTAVLTTARQPVDALVRALTGRVRNLRQVGDCVAPRDVGMAFYMAEKLGREL